jgi:hypothetical protein
MIHTENDARARRCTPSLVLMLLDRERYEALLLTNALTQRCIGSECMQWRWYDQANEQGLTYYAANALPYTSKGNGRKGIYTSAVFARGYCGLAGRVE